MSLETLVAAIGEALIDFKASGPLAFQGFPGGSPYTVAIAMARLGLPCAYMTQISSDLLGQPLRRHLSRNGVDLQAVGIRS